MARPTLTPYRQGRLDGLCGVYAVINAVRLACSSEDHTIHLPSRLLFETCLGYLALDNSLPGAVIYGFDTAPLLVCLRLVRNYLEVKRGIRIRQTRPLMGRQGMTMQSVARVISEYLALPHRSVLLGYSAAEPDWGHWTVIQSVADGHFVLLDSGGGTRLTFAKLTYQDWTKAKAQRKRNVTPGGIIFLERLPAGRK